MDAIVHHRLDTREFAWPPVDLARYVQCFDHALEPSFCAARLIESFERTGRLTHSRNGRDALTAVAGKRMGPNSTS